MPTYEYRCDSCGHEFEQFQSISARPLKTCPECKRRTLRRLIGTGGGIIFKGSGFYQTDYRSESYRKAAEADKKAATQEPKDTPAKKTDNKPTTSEKKTKSKSSGSGQAA